MFADTADDMADKKANPEQKEKLLYPDTGQDGDTAQTSSPQASATTTQGTAQVDVAPENVTDTLLYLSDGVDLADSRRSRSSSPAADGQRSRARSRSPRSYGASKTITSLPMRSRSPTPTRDGNFYVPEPNFAGGSRGKYTLNPPAIIYDKVSTAPNSPTNDAGIQLKDVRMHGSSNQLDSKAVMVTPSGSLLAVNQSPLELRESTLTVNYPGCDGK